MIPKEQIPKTQFPVFFIYFFLGFAAIVVQSVLIREFLVIAGGNELIIGTIFSVWFLWIVLGASLGTSVVEKIKNINLCFWLILFAGLFLYPFQVISIRLAKVIFSVPIGMYMSFWKAMSSAFLFISPFSFMIGLTFPLGARLFQKAFSQEAKIIGAIYLYEAVGSLVGGLIFTFFIIKFWNPFQVSVLLLMFAVLILLFFVRRMFFFKGAHWLFFILLGAGIVLTIMAKPLHNWSVNQRWFTIAGKQNQLLSSLDTPYDHISLARLGDQYSVFQNGQLAFSFPDPFTSTVKTNLILLQHPKPEQILVIGAGFCELLDTMVDHVNLHVDWLIKDRKFYKQIEPLLSGKNNEQMNIFFEDGRAFFRTNSKKYDIIYLDLPPPSTASLNRFYSYEFFKLVQNNLNDHGILVLQLPISDNYLRQEVLQFVSSIYKTLKDIFLDIKITSGEVNYIFATNRPGILPSEFEEILARWKADEKDFPGFSIYSLLPFFEPERINYLKEKIENFPNPVLNTDMKPVSYLYNLVLWNIFSGNDRIFSYLWIFFDKIRVPHLIIILILFIGARIGWIVLKKKGSQGILCWNSMFGVFVAGFTAISLDIVLLFGFQNLFGSLYQNIALLTAVFMFGLATGSWLVNKNLVLINHVKFSFIVLEIMSIPLTLFILIFLKIFGQQIITFFDTQISQLFYFLVVLLVGVFSGAIFPLAGKGITDSGATIGKAASFVDAADHSGASVGAFLTGTFLVPTVGFSGIVWIVVLCNFTAVLFWFTYRNVATQIEKYH